MEYLSVGGREGDDWITGREGDDGITIRWGIISVGGREAGDWITIRGNIIDARMEYLSVLLV